MRILTTGLVFPALKVFADFRFEALFDAFIRFRLDGFDLSITMAVVVSVRVVVTENAAAIDRSPEGVDERKRISQQAAAARVVRLDSHHHAAFAALGIELVAARARRVNLGLGFTLRRAIRAAYQGGCEMSYLTGIAAVQAGSNLIDSQK